MGWVVSTKPRPIYPLERDGTHFVGGWVSYRTGLDRCVKSRPLMGLDPRTVRPVAICNTGCRMP
jgi:hypothetical protein